MIPRNVSRQRIVLLCLSLMALAVFIPVQTDKVRATHGAIQEYTKGFCVSERDKPVVYFSKIFHVKITAKAIDTQPLVNAFTIHLKEVYDYKTNSNYPVGCPLYRTLGEAEGTKRELEAKAQGPGKQIVEVDWTPPAWGQVLQSADPNFMPQAPPTPTHTYCAVGHESTMYFSAVFDTVGALNNQAWADGFNEFLTKRYSAQGEVTCTIMNTVREAEQNLKARVAGVGANSHKAVETGWKYDPTTASSIKPRPKPTPKEDDDPEPAPPRPAAPPPSVDIRDFAAKEGSAALTLCQNDRVMSGAFDCYRVQRAVYNYRIEHAGDVRPEPLVNLLDKLDCSQCIVDYLLKMWAKSAAQSRGLKPNAADCVAQRFLTNLQAKPYPGHVKELYNATIAACNK